MFTRRLLVALFAVLVWLPLNAIEPVFRAGAATSNITPWLGLEIEGNMHMQLATNIHDELHARCIVLDDGTNKLAILTADSCMILRETFDAAKKRVHEKTGLPPENILMSTTHTHSAPSAVGLFQTSPDPDYQNFLTSRMADAVIRALNNLEPAKVGWAVGQEPNQVFNRRWIMKPGVKNINPFGGEDAVRMNPGNANANPDLLDPAGPTDPEVSVLSVQSLDGRPIGLLANYSLHYCGNVGAGTISADYFGAFCERMTDLLKADRQSPHPPFVAIMSNGASGDCNNINFREPHKKEPPFEQINRVAEAVAKAAYDAVRKIEYRSWIPVNSAQKEITLGVRLPSKEEVEFARIDLENAVKTPNGQLRNRDDIYRRETVLMENFNSQTNLLIQAHRIGDLGIVAIPCEVFVEIGLEIKKQSSLKPTFIISLANGYNGYLPTPEHHKLGGYETWRARSSYLEVNASAKITATVTELLQQVSR
ncbi:MAG: neutral/alkaline non-lysosomal ceramidase N-terminal domain-containing protein [Verrucomicrobia bacterium]|nr:neutral/alkaline non-lysosomal ceramidase N-terminal domain-containing protein [Verrucomicrobiota bacterium]